MKKCFRLVVLVMCFGWLLTLLGCGTQKPQMLDGPGMEYQCPWTAFTLSGVDYWFQVTETDTEALVTGSCRDQDGRICESETGIPISAEDLWKLRWLDLHTLEDAREFQEDPEHVLDGSKVTLTLTLPNGQVVAKNASLMLSLEIYEILLPYFKN